MFSFGRVEDERARIIDRPSRPKSCRRAVILAFPLTRGFVRGRASTRARLTCIGKGALALASLTEGALLLVVIVPAVMPATIAAPVIWTVIVTVPATIAIVARLIVIVVSMPVVPVRAIVVRTPPAASPRIANPGNLVDIGWRCRGRRDRHGAGRGLWRASQTPQQM